MEALANPVSRSVRQVRSLGIEASCGVAATAFQKVGIGILPVIQDDKYVGVLTEEGLRRAIEDGVHLDSSIQPYIEDAFTIAPYATGAEALRHFETQSNPVAVVVDDGGVVWGLLFPSDLFPKPPVRLRPPSIGGMAAPFGVYLTTGITSGGTSKWGLVASGANLAILLLLGRIFAYGTVILLGKKLFSEIALENIGDVLTFAYFAILMRLAPISGYHAAEHQVVHAIERGENLTVESVSRMPRVHPRCGTNLAAGVILASLIAFTNVGIPQDFLPLQEAFGVAVGLAFWRRAGAFAQYWVTTKPASKKQLEAGISSGEQLLQSYADSHNLRPNSWRSLVSSGLLQVAFPALGL